MHQTYAPPLSSAEIALGLEEAFRQMGALLIAARESNAPLTLNVDKMEEIALLFYIQRPPQSPSAAEGRRRAFEAFTAVVSHGPVVLDDDLQGRFFSICLVLALHLLPPTPGEIDHIMRQLLQPMPERK